MLLVSLNLFQRGFWTSFKVRWGIFCPDLRLLLLFLLPFLYVSLCFVYLFWPLFLEFIQINPYTSFDRVASGTLKDWVSKRWSEWCNYSRGSINQLTFCNLAWLCILINLHWREINLLSGNIVVCIGVLGGTHLVVWLLLLLVLILSRVRVVCHGRQVLQRFNIEPDTFPDEWVFRNAKCW